MNAFEATASDGKEEKLHARLLTLFESQNRADPGKTSIEANYLKVVVDKK